MGVGIVMATGWLSASLIARTQAMSTPATPQVMPMRGMNMSAGPTMTKDQKIANAMTAGPASISAKATILDWPAKEGQAPSVIRAGTNGWSCLPDMPDTKGNDPMCLDKSWMTWFDAYMTHTSPHVTTVGVGYMMAPGGGEGSNTDPFAMAATPTNHWGHHPPHTMILVPDLKSLDGMSSDPANGGPYVMFPGTPYAHIMAPVK